MEKKRPDKGPRDRDSKVTEEHIEESKRLRARWDSDEGRLAREPHVSQGAFGEHWGIGNQAMVGFCLNGKIAIPLKAAIAFSRGLQIPIASFSPRLALLVASAKSSSNSGGPSFSARATAVAAALDAIQNQTRHEAMYHALMTVLFRPESVGGGETARAAPAPAASRTAKSARHQ